MSYTTIQLPTEFVKQKIDPIVEQKKHGFSSRANLVIEAVKALAEKIAKEAHDASDPAPIKSPEILA